MFIKLYWSICASPSKILAIFLNLIALTAHIDVMKLVKPKDSQRPQKTKITRARHLTRMQRRQMRKDFRALEGSRQRRPMIPGVADVGARGVKRGGEE